MVVMSFAGPTITIQPIYLCLGLIKIPFLVMLFLALSRLENALNRILYRAGERKLYFIKLNLSMTLLSI